MEVQSGNMKEKFPCSPLLSKTIATSNTHFLFNLSQINLSLHLIKMYQSRLKENSMVLYLDERLKEVLAINYYNYYCFKWFCWITEEDLLVFQT